MIFMTLLAISILVVSPTVTKIMQREHEEELIFRGRQYAGALVNFQKRQGRFPLALKELMKTQPRSARKLYKEPMCNCDNWGLIRVGQPWPPPQTGTNPAGDSLSTTSGPSPAGGPFPRQTRPGSPVPDTYTIPPPEGGTGQQNPGTGGGGSGTGGGSGDDMGSGGGQNQEVSNVPIIGVYSKVHKKGLRTFHGEEYYDRWGFVAGANNDPDLPANFSGNPMVPTNTHVPKKTNTPQPGTKAGG